ncbi:O-antigen ligase family protein [Stenotrophomonas chelatiphaga]|uniref:O-antigen ligase family protein n=1 Tax=Stenotrophomonas chelatiphaga TaxID=517011 RepID=UPI00289D27AB|nr:O-antigen ligase family protein [Stenotrophomonas chelatiphaga]
MKFRPHNAISIAPVSWLLGFNVLIFHAAVFWFFLTSRRRGLSLQTLGLLAYILIYAASLSYALARGEQLERIIASAYNLSYWILGLMILSSRLILDQDRIAASSAKVLLFSAAVAVFFLATHGFADLTYNSLLGSALGGVSLPSLVQDSMKLYIFGVEWADSDLAIRAKIMAPYPTALAAMVLLLLALAAPKNLHSQRKNIFYGALLLIGLALTVLTQSRAGLLSLVLFMALLGATTISSRFSSSQKLSLLIVIVCLALPLSLAVRQAASAMWTDAVAYRESSSSYRFSLYEFGVKHVTTESPIIGFGVKHEVPQYKIPVGSHSTFIGAFYKTGILGLAALVIFWLASVVRAIRALVTDNDLRRRASSCAFLAMMPFFMFEDVDAPQFVAFLLFLSLYIATYSSRQGTGDPL